jgi:hypothetical protein
MLGRVALTDWERRPRDEDYYAERTTYVRQGDLFRDVPLAYPWPPDAVSHEAGKRKFLSGPFESGFGMLISATCSFTAQGAPGYAHPVRVLAPVLPLAHLVEQGVVKTTSLDDLRVYDHLVNYFYLPAIVDEDLPESLALLYAAITVHHDYLEERRVAQLSPAAAIHLKYKLTALFAGERFSHADFDDEID